MSNIETYTTPCGVFSIDTEADASITKTLRAGRCHQEGVITFLSAFAQKGDTVLDIGAHIGTISVPLAKRGRKVVSFEPSAEAYPLLVQNAQRNEISIDARKKGLGDKVSRATLTAGDKGNAGSRSLLEGKGDIEVVRLDEEGLHDIKAIKIDVEGMEVAVLRGGGTCINRDRPTVLFEVNYAQMRAHGASLRALSRFFCDRNYSLYLFRDAPTSGEAVRLGRIASLKVVTFLIIPGSLLLGHPSPVFDVAAIPNERAVAFPIDSRLATLARLFREKALDGIRRFGWLSR